MVTGLAPALLALAGLGAASGAALGFWALRLVDRIYEIDSRLTGCALAHLPESGPRLWLEQAGHLDAS